MDPDSPMGELVDSPGPELTHQEIGAEVGALIPPTLKHAQMI